MKKQINLIAVDMDGTLVGSDHRISSACTAAIHRAQSKGIEFIITTGRVYDETIPQLHEANIHCKCLVMNGAQLRDQDGQILMNHPIDPVHVRRIVKELFAQQLYIELYTNQGIYTMSPQVVVLDAVAVKLMYFIPKLRYDKAITMVKDEREYQKLIFTTIEDFDYDHLQVSKILSFSKHTQVMAKIRAQYALREGISASSSFPINLEITCAQAQKGIALKAYAAQNNIDPSTIMTIGDSYNDLSMLGKDFGHTVAMGNAIDEVKQLACYETLDNDHDGVAHAIHQLFQTI